MRDSACRFVLAIIPESLHVSGTYHLSCTTKAHHIFMRRHFSGMEMFQSVGSRLRPSDCANDTAAPNWISFIIMEVVGLPPTLRMIAMMVEIPGEMCNSENSVSVAWFHMKRESGQYSEGNSGEFLQKIIE